MRSQDFAYLLRQQFSSYYFTSASPDAVNIYKSLCREAETFPPPLHRFYVDRTAFSRRKEVSSSPYFPNSVFSIPQIMRLILYLRPSSLSNLSSRALLHPVPRKMHIAAKTSLALPSRPLPDSRIFVQPLRISILLTAPFFPTIIAKNPPFLSLDHCRAVLKAFRSYPPPPPPPPPPTCCLTKFPPSSL